MKDLFTDLNPEQVAAVKHLEGPALVVAGPGSGKTRVLTHHAAYLITQGVNPENILLVTFTNKAANEMKARITRLLSLKSETNKNRLPWSGTFHSICARLLRRDGKDLGLDPNFAIFDTGDSQTLIRQILKEFGLEAKKINPNAVLSAIGSAKGELIGPKEYETYAHGFFYEKVAQIFPEYQKRLYKNRALDFDDLLFDAVKLFRQVPAILKRYQNIFEHVLVDEYQDTNKAQYVFGELLSQEHKNIYVVGDMSQAIYSFRGADYRNILNFERDFPDVKTYRLSQNYRSTPTIVEAAKSLIAHNHNHLALDLWTQKKGGEKIKLFEARDELDEASYIVNVILTELSAKRSRLNAFAILYRTNAQSRIIEEVFLHQNLPYVLVGGTRFYERKEIKDALSLLRLFQNSSDNVSRERIEKIGKKFLANYLIFISKGLIGAKGANPIGSLEILDLVLERSGYLNLFDQKNKEDLERLENIKELRSVAAAFPSLTEFLENVQLVQQEYLVSDKGRLNREAQPNAVTLMTLHSAKGLEFPTVFLVGLEEGLLPHARALFDTNELEEERRLCYVGLTRAKENLHLTYTRSRFYFGSRQSGRLSRFVSEIPADLIDDANAKKHFYDY